MISINQELVAAKKPPLDFTAGRLFYYETSFFCYVQIINRFFDFGLLTRIHDLD